MADRVVSYVCQYCQKLFKSAHSCQRHLTRSHTGHPAAYPVIVLLHGRHGPEDGFAHAGTTVPHGSAAGSALPQAPVAPAGGGEGGPQYMEDEPPLIDASVLRPAPSTAPLVTSICGRVRDLYERFGDAATSRPMHAESALRPSPFDSPFLRQALHHATLASWTGSSRTSSRSLWRLLTTTPDGGSAPPRSCAAVIKASFKSSSSFSGAIKHEQQLLVHRAGWMEALLNSSSGGYPQPGSERRQEAREG